MNWMQYSYLIPLLPLIGAAINGFVSFAGIKTPKWFVNLVGCGSILSAFIISCGLFHQLSQLPAESRSITTTFFTWFDMDLLKANIAFLIDPLSCVMILVVSGVGFLIHVYSIGYMEKDPGYARFFSYLNLFCFAMLTLVLADNMLLMFVGWEGVGLCSYLLIGFWFDHKPNAVAGMKAFIVNRVGDFGFLLGMLVLFWGMVAAGHGTVTFAELRENIHLLEGWKIGAISGATLSAILLFVGATGKSAQIPLYVWLPDAMAGPTPVSALIHAATMVTAGVYMIGRMNFLYTMSPNALIVVATVGAVTALFAASIGFAQNDIKKVLAYSTVSQLGYMFLGMGTGIYSAGIFHLVTHAFFKACLFLGAGSVILGMHHEQDIQKMGGLRKYMPVTFWTFLAATLALSGIFPLSGFFSKDEILWQTFAKAGNTNLFYVLWGLGLAGAIGTAFYMFRCIALTFFGKLKTKGHADQHEEDVLDDMHCVGDHHRSLTPQESPKVITFVLIALAILSVVAGVIGMPHAIGKFFGLPNLFEQWLEPVFAAHITPTVAVTAEAVKEVSHASAFTEYLLMILSVGLALLSALIATKLYTKRIDIIKSFTHRFHRLYTLVLNKYYIDELYQLLFVKSLLKLINYCRDFDNKIVDGLVNLTAAAGVVLSKVSGWFDWTYVDGAVNVVADSTIAGGRRLRKIQTGRIQHYFYIAVIGVIIALLWQLV